MPFASRRFARRRDNIEWLLAAVQYWTWSGGRKLSGEVGPYIRVHTGVWVGETAAEGMLDSRSIHGGHVGRYR